MLIGHRGYRACFPENTLAAFAASLGRCGMIELDLQLSRDRQVVVVHDASLARTSDAAVFASELGLPSLAVCDWSLAQLRQLDFGTWFLRADPFATLRTGQISRDHLSSLLPQRIMTLAEVLAWSKAQAMPLNLEIKDQGRGDGAELIVPPVIRAVRESGCDRVLLSCFNHAYLRLCRQLAPEIPLAALQQGQHPPDLIGYLKTLGAAAYHPADRICEPALVRELRAAGLVVNVYTVNDPARQRQLFDFGVNGIFTDFPNQQQPDPFWPWPGKPGSN